MWTLFPPLLIIYIKDFTVRKFPLKYMFLSDLTRISVGEKKVRNATIVFLYPCPFSAFFLLSLFFPLPLPLLFFQLLFLWYGKMNENSILRSMVLATPVFQLKDTGHQREYLCTILLKKARLYP